MPSEYTEGAISSVRTNITGESVSMPPCRRHPSNPPTVAPKFKSHSTPLLLSDVTRVDGFSMFYVLAWFCVMLFGIANTAGKQ